jgi:hypothetical protein
MDKFCAFPQNLRVYDDFPIVGERPVRGAASQSALERGTIIMGINQSSREEPRPAAIEKKPYEKPGFRYEQVFVTSALSCGKIDPTSASCTHNLSAS